MDYRFLCGVLFLMVLALLHEPVESKKVVIHIPYRVKNVKHTHTVYKILPHHRKAKSNDDDNEHYDDYR